LLTALLLDWGATKKNDDLPLMIQEDASQSPNASSSVSRSGASSTPRIPYWLTLLVILALAAFMRLWHFTSLPFGVWYDEAEYVLQTNHFLNLPGVWPIMSKESIRPTGHYLFLIALAFRSFGESIYAV